MKKLAVFLLPISIMACSQLPIQQTQGTTSQSQQILLNSKTLSAYAWQITDAKDANGQSIAALLLSKDKPITLNFSDRSIHVSNTCNRMNGGYELTKDTLIVKALASTMMACQNDLNQADQAIGKILAGTLNIGLQANAATPVLTLTTATKEQIILQGIPTPETKYGAQGETIFLEIAPETKPCSAGVMQTQCLQVREIRYNEQGIKTFVSPEWTNFYDNIEGYQHSNNTRQVLRLKKYPVKNPPADASSNAYVLDMIVETELVR